MSEPEEPSTFDNLLAKHPHWNGVERAIAYGVWLAAIAAAEKKCEALTYGRRTPARDGFLAAIDSADHDGFRLGKGRCLEALAALREGKP